MSQAEHPNIREFTQKMRNEGSAGFADGPWEETEFVDDNKLTANQRKKKNWAMSSSRRTKQRTLGDRVLTWVTILTLITLIAGVGGTWFSYQPEPEVTVTRTDQLNKTPSLERVESRLTRMEKRLSHILDPYIRMLNNLSGELDDTQKQLLEHIQAAEQQQATTTTGIEDRLSNVEQRLAVADERMDTLSTMLATLPASNSETVPGMTQNISPAPAMANTPPEISPTEPVTTDQKAANDSSQPAAQLPVEQRGVIARAPETAPGAATPAVTPAPESVPATRQQQADVPVPEPAAPIATTSKPTTATGNWVINIASYTNERIARRNLAQMQQQGVDVELVTAEVNGKTIYRARVFGFANRRDAAAAAAKIKSKLGLEETWIAKR